VHGYLSSEVICYDNCSLLRTHNVRGQHQCILSRQVEVIIYSLNSQSRLLNFSLSDWFSVHRLSANKPTFCLIRKLDHVSCAVALKRFRRDAEVLSKIMQ